MYLQLIKPVVIIIAVLLVVAKTAYEIKKMMDLKPETDILLRISSPIPYICLLIIFTPCYLLSRAVGDSFYIPILGLGFLLAAIVQAGYFLMRRSRNKTNNDYLEKCQIKGVVFVPGNLFIIPIVKDNPWTEEDKNRVTFVPPQTNVKEAIGHVINPSNPEKERLRAFAVITGVIFGTFCVIKLIEFILKRF